MRTAPPWLGLGLGLMWGPLLLMMSASSGPPFSASRIGTAGGAYGDVWAVGTRCQSVGRCVVGSSVCAGVWFGYVMDVEMVFASLDQFWRAFVVAYVCVCGDCVCLFGFGRDPRSRLNSQWI